MIKIQKEKRMNSYKQLLVLVSYVFPIFSHMHNYYPTKDTADKIVSCLYQHKKGAYFSFTLEEIGAIISHEHQYLRRELMEACVLSGPNIYQALPLLCKGPFIFSKEIHSNIEAKLCYQLINQVKSFGRSVDHIFASNLLSLLLYKDIHYCVRFLKLLSQNGHLIGLMDKEYANELHHFFKKIDVISIDSNDYKPVNELEQILTQKINCDNKFKIILISSGFMQKVLAKRAYLKNSNIFIFDIGTFVQDLTSEGFRKKIDFNFFNRIKQRDIKIVYTAAVLPQRFQERKNEYLHSLNILRHYWYDPYIIEACNKNSFFDHFSHQVVYSKVNNKRLRNKGVNEAHSIRVGLKKLSFNNKDLIIKLTGRYYFKDELFLRLVESSPEYDGYITLDPRSHYSFSGCFGLRYDYFKQLIDSINLNEMERRMIDFEKIVLDFFRKIEYEKGASILYLDEIGIYANVNHSWIFQW